MKVLERKTFPHHEESIVIPDGAEVVKIIDEGNSDIVFYTVDE